MSDSNQEGKHSESRDENGSSTRISNSRLRIPTRPEGTSFPPNSFVAAADKRHALVGIYMTYWLALLGYAATVRVLAAPGRTGSRALGYIDRAQDVENYCIATVAVLITSCFGACAIVGVPMAAVAVGLCIMEAVRLSKDPERRVNERNMLCALAGAISPLLLLQIREGFVWIKWVINNRRSAGGYSAVHVVR